MPHDIRTKSSRALLAYQQAPHFHALGDGLAIGVRIGKSRAQTWVARYRHDGKQHHEPLGALHTVDDKTRFAYACELARQYAAKLAGGLQLEAGTVAAAMQRYVEHVEKDRPKAAQDAGRALAYNVLSHSIASVPLDKLTAPQFKAWRDGLEQSRLPDDFDPTDDDAKEIKRRIHSTCNRIIATVRAALSLAYRDGYVGNDAAWRHLGKWPKVDGKRRVLLTEAQVRAITKAAAPDMRQFIKGLWLTTFRPGELAALRVKDFDPVRGHLEVRVSKTGPRDVVLPPDAAALFRQQIRSKLPAAPIFARADGSPWKSSNHWRPAFRAAVEAAGIVEREDEPLVPYHVRHGALSHLLAHNVNAVGLKDLSGTSLDMLDKTYAKALHVETARQIAKARRSA